MACFEAAASTVTVTVPFCAETTATATTTAVDDSSGKSSRLMARTPWRTGSWGSVCQYAPAARPGVAEPPARVANSRRLWTLGYAVVQFARPWSIRDG